MMRNCSGRYDYDAYWLLVLIDVATLLPWVAGHVTGGVLWGESATRGFFFLLGCLTVL